MTSPYLLAFFAAERPIVKVLISAMLGAIASLEWTNLMPLLVRDALAKLVVRMMIPCLLVYSLGSFATLDRMTEWFWVPLMIVINNFLGLLLGWLLCLVAGHRTVGQKESVVLVSTSMGNHGALVLACCGAICRFGFALDEGFNGMPDMGTCRDSALGIVCFGICAGDIYNYTMGPYLLQRKQKEKDDYVPIQDEREQSDAAQLWWTPGGFWAFLQTVEMPLLAVCVGLMIGIIPPLKATFHGHGAPLNSMADAFKMVGYASIPLQLLLLGGNLMSKKEVEDKADENLHPVLLVGIIVIRLVLLPAAGVSLVMMFQTLGIAPTDPLILFIMLLEMSTPTGISVTMFMNYYDTPGKASVAFMTIVQYIVAIPIMTFLITIYLLMATSTNFD